MIPQLQIIEIEFDLQVAGGSFRINCLIGKNYLFGGKEGIITILCLVIFYWIY